MYDLSPKIQEVDIEYLAHTDEFFSSLIESYCLIYLWENKIK